MKAKAQLMYTQILKNSKKITKSFCTLQEKKLTKAHSKQCSAQSNRSQKMPYHVHHNTTHRRKGAKIPHATVKNVLLYRGIPNVPRTTGPNWPLPRKTHDEHHAPP